jgi:HlyD family secretion protein
MVLQVPIKKGNSVIKSNSFNDGTTIAVVANMNDMIFQGFIDESEVGKLKEGMDLDISIGALQDVKLDAKLEHISPKGKIENGAIQFEIKAKINTIDTIYLRAGYSANADIILEKRDSVLSVKESWLTFKKDTAFVEVEKMAQKFDKRKLKLGLSDGINIQVLEGVNENEVIKTNSKL